jgi:hypothetical protein
LVLICSFFALIHRTLQLNFETPFLPDREARTHASRKPARSDVDKENGKTKYH